MKTTTKIVLGAAVVIAVSAGAAIVTTYAMMKPDQKKALAFDDIFQQNPDVRLAALNAGDLRPVDLTAAAESSVHAVVHIKSTQSAKKQNVVVNEAVCDGFGGRFGDRRGGQQQLHWETRERGGVGSGVIISIYLYILTNN